MDFFAQDLYAAMGRPGCPICQRVAADEWQYFINFVRYSLNDPDFRDQLMKTRVAERLRSLSLSLEIRFVTADTFGSAARELAGLPLQSTVLPQEERGEAKAAVVESLGAGRTVAVGNGSNDVAMLGRAALGIVVNGPEGCAQDALLAADIVVPDTGAALDLLLKPERLVATWRP